MIYIKNSSLFLFNKDSFIRRMCIKLANAPDQENQTTQNIAEMHGYYEDDEDEPEDNKISFLETKPIERKKTLMRSDNLSSSKKLKTAKFLS
jgi:hypothetical protein